MKRRPLGQMLVQRGVISPPKLKEALELQRNSGNRLASECFVQQFADEKQVLASLSSQVGVPGIHLAKLVLPLTFLDVVPEQIATKQSVLPVRVDGQRIFLAMADPHDDSLISEIEFTSSRKVLACVALQAPLQRVITVAYNAKKKGELEYRGALANNLDPNVDQPMDFIYAEELTHIPRELIQPDPSRPEIKSSPGKMKSGEIIIEMDEANPQEGLEIAIGEDNTFSIEYRGTSSEAPAVSEPDKDALRVLVVDDDLNIRRLVTRLLKSRGMVVEEAGRGLEALNQIKKAPPDLIVLDAMLPEVHGFDICRKIKSSDRYGRIPVVMISSIYRGWRFAQDLKDTYGVDAFLEKPFELDALWNTIERVLASRRKKKDGRSERKISVSAKKAIQEGVKFYKAGDLDSAIDRYKEGIRIDPLSTKLHYQLAILYLKKKGMTYQAMQEFEEALALDPEHFSALKNLALLYQSKGFKNKAIDMWERSLRCSTDPETRDHIRKHLMNLINRATS